MAIRRLRSKGGIGRDLVRQAAIHESGHAAAYYALGESIKCIKVIDAPKNVWGRCYGSRYGQPQNAKDPNVVRREVIVSFAGDIALQHFGLGKKALDWDDDNVIQLAVGVCSSEDETVELLNKLRRESFDLMDTDRVGIFVNALVSKLLETKTKTGSDITYMLTGDQVKELWESSNRNP
jgi:hypothetical protein